MHRLSRLRPTPALIVACVALIIALGGTSYAAITLPAGSVGTKQLKYGAVTSAKVKNGSLTLSDISAASLSKLGRVAAASDDGIVSASGQTVVTVSLTVPRTGFVLVQGWAAAVDANGQWGVRLYDDSTIAASSWINYVTGTGTYSTSGQSWVFPVTAGERTFSARVFLYGAGAGFAHYSTITAQFIPYSGTGSPTLPPGSAPAKGSAEAGQQN